MSILRWIIAIIVSLLITTFGMPLVNNVLNILIVVFGGSGRTGWGIIPTDFCVGLSFFNFVIFPWCISLGITYGIAGFCSGKLIPSGNEKVAMWNVV